MKRRCLVAVLFACLLASPLVVAQTGDGTSLEELNERVDALEKDSGLLSKLGSMLTLYGFVRVDAVYDDSEFNDTQVAFRVLSEGGANGVRRNNADFSLYSRLTRLGFLIDAGTIAEADVTGKLEFDFYDFNTSDSRDRIRLRHAYLLIDKGRVSFLAGQTFDLISPLYPSVNPDLLNWNVGNLGDRRPQIRATTTQGIGADGAFVAAGAIALQDAITNRNSDLDGVTDGENSGKPQLQGRVAYRKKLGSRNLEVGVWGARGWEQVDGDGRGDFDMVVYGLDVKVPIADTVVIQGELWQGQNLADVRGGVGQGIVAGQEVDAHGGWIQGTYIFKELCDVFAGYTFDSPDRSDVTLGGTSAGITNNSGVYAGVTLTKYKPVVVGFDAMHWRTRYRGINSGKANRFRLYFALNF